MQAPGLARCSLVNQDSEDGKGSRCRAKIKFPELS